ncbi:hypothetical protein ACFYWY_36890 [Streptomyces sp. NPDC002870]|uniref:hypothetical protein n=1 Tax=Streptomyces sp. NPDC002870 TaxID=3364666 RepID=UPI0036C5D6E7
MYLPQSLDGLSFALLGEHVMQAHPDKALEFSRLCGWASVRVRELAGSLGEAEVLARDALPEQVAEAFAGVLSTFSGSSGVGYLPKFADELERLQQQLAEISMQIEETHRMLLAELLLLAAELAFLAASVFYTAGLSLAKIALAKARSRVRILTILAALSSLGFLVQPIAEGLQELFLGLFVQLSSMWFNPDDRKRTHLDGRQLAMDFTQGLLGGMFGWGLDKLFAPVLKPLKNVLGTWTYKGIEGLAQFPIGGFSEFGAEFFNNGLWDGKWSADVETLLGGGLSSVVTYALMDGMHEFTTWLKSTSQDWFKGFGKDSRLGPHNTASFDDVDRFGFSPLGGPVVPMVTPSPPVTKPDKPLHLVTTSPPPVNPPGPPPAFYGSGSDSGAFKTWDTGVGPGKPFTADGPGFDGPNRVHFTEPPPGYHTLSSSPPPYRPVPGPANTAPVLLGGILDDGTADPFATSDTGKGTGSVDPYRVAPITTGPSTGPTAETLDTNPLPRPLPTTGGGRDGAVNPYDLIDLSPETGIDLGDQVLAEDPFTRDVDPHLTTDVPTTTDIPAADVPTAAGPTRTTGSPSVDAPAVGSRSADGAPAAERPHAPRTTTDTVTPPTTDTEHTGTSGAADPAPGTAGPTATPTAADFDAARQHTPPVRREHTWLSPGPVDPFAPDHVKPELVPVHSAFDVRRFTHDGQPVTNITMEVQLAGAEDLTSAELDAVWQRITAGVDRLNAAGYRTPAEDRLHLTVTPATPNTTPHLTPRLAGPDSGQEMTHDTWRTDATPDDYAWYLGKIAGLVHRANPNNHPFYRPEVTDSYTLQPPTPLPTSTSTSDDTTTSTSQPARPVHTTSTDLPTTQHPAQATTPDPAPATASQSTSSRFYPPPPALDEDDDAMSVDSDPAPGAVLADALRREKNLDGVVRDLLVSLSGVTVVVDDAANFGHQAAATMLMDSLQELGYSGRITVIAPESVRDRLGMLVPDAMNQRIDWRTGTFDSESPQPDSRLGGTAPAGESLVLVAASDRLDSDAETAKGFLDFVGADRAVVLKPYAWGESRRLFYSRSGPDSAVTVHDLEDGGTGTSPIPGSAVYRFDVPALSGPELDALIDTQVGGSRGEGLRAVTDAVRGGWADLMPVYGLHNVAAPGRASAVGTLAAGVHAAGLGKPSVVLTFGDATVPFAPRHIADWLVHAGLGEADLAERIAGLGPDQVLVVNGGRLPQDVFRQVYQLGSLPAVLEGANTSNLVQLLGRSFFSVLTNHTPYDRLDPDAADRLQGVTDAIVGESEWGAGLEDAAGWEELQAADTALSVLRSLPAQDGGRLLTQDEMLRLTEVLSTEQITEILGDGDDTVQRMVGYDPNDMRQFKRQMRDPAEVVVTSDQVMRLQEAVDVYRTGQEAVVRDATAGYSVAPRPEQTQTVAAAIRESLTEGTALHTYFQGLAAQARDPRNDQVLQALRFVLSTTPDPAPATASQLASSGFYPPPPAGETYSDVGATADGPTFGEVSMAPAVGEGAGDGGDSDEDSGDEGGLFAVPLRPGGWVAAAEVSVEPERLSIDVAESVDAWVAVSSPDSLAAAGARLSDVLPEEKWWQLFIDPRDHERALTFHADDPGSIYEGEQSPGFRQGMMEAYRVALDSPAGVSRRMNAMLYLGLHNLVIAHLSAKPGWSGGQETSFPLRHGDLSEDILQEGLDGRPLVLDLSTYDPNMPTTAITGLDRRDRVLKTLYRKSEAPGLVDAAFDRYYDEISRADGDFGKLAAISRVVRALQVIHPFKDANRRVNVHLLLHKLLLEQGFGPVVTTDLARLFQGGFSAEQMARTLSRHTTPLSPGSGHATSSAPAPQPTGELDAVGPVVSAVSDMAVAPSVGTGPTMVSPSLVAVTPGQWESRRGDARPALLRTERFDPKADPLASGRRGLLNGWGTLIRTDIRHIQADNGAWVRSLTVELPVRVGEGGFEEGKLAALEERIQGLLDGHVNAGFRLPKSGDQLHVEVKLTPARKDDPYAVHVTVSPDPGRSDQLHFHLRENATAAQQVRDSATLLHEILHYAGLSDRYRDSDSLFRRGPGKGDTAGVMADVSVLPDGTFPLEYLTEIENTTDSGPVVYDLPFTTPPALAPQPAGETQPDTDATADAVIFGEVSMAPAVDDGANALSGVDVVSAELAFGMPRGNYGRFARLARERRLRILVRPTNAEAPGWLERGALPKPKDIKAKTINRVDVHLGAARGHVGLVGFFEPRMPERAGVEDAESGLWERIEQRFRQRSEEFEALGPVMGRLAEEGRFFVKDGLVYGLDAAGERRPITGDHDVFDVTTPGGSELTPRGYGSLVETMMASDMAVMHGAHMYWPGPRSPFSEQIFIRIVENHRPGGEPLLEFRPDSDSAVRVWAEGRAVSASGRLADAPVPPPAGETYSDAGGTADGPTFGEVSKAPVVERSRGASAGRVGGLRGGSPDTAVDPLAAGWVIGRAVTVEGPRRGGLVEVPVSQVPVRAGKLRAGGVPERWFTYVRSSASRSVPFSYEVSDAGLVRLSVPGGEELSPEGWTRFGDDFIHLPSGALLRGDSGWIGRVGNLDTLGDAMGSLDPGAAPYTLVAGPSDMYLVPVVEGDAAVRIALRDDVAGSSSALLHFQPEDDADQAGLGDSVQYGEDMGGASPAPNLDSRAAESDNDSAAGSAATEDESVPAAVEGTPPGMYEAPRWTGPRAVEFEGAALVLQEPEGGGERFVEALVLAARSVVAPQGFTGDARLVAAFSGDLPPAQASEVLYAWAEKNLREDTVAGEEPLLALDAVVTTAELRALGVSQSKLAQAALMGDSLRVSDIGLSRMEQFRVLVRRSGDARSGVVARTVAAMAVDELGIRLALADAGNPGGDITWTGSESGTPVLVLRDGDHYLAAVPASSGQAAGPAPENPPPPAEPTGVTGTS